MTQAQKRIWCPQCHKRHLLPGNVGDLTLRCRGCKFAFLVNDALYRDPTEAPASPRPAQIVIGKPSGGRNQNAKSQVDSPGSDQAAPAPSPVAEEPEVSLDANYDDILDVLEKPSSAPLKRTIPSTRKASPEAFHEEVDSAEEPVLRVPISKDQFRKHRQMRELWMFLAALCCCLLGMGSWFLSKSFSGEQLALWEHHTLVNVGVPQRFLPEPPFDPDGKLPQRHIALVGNKAGLADRSDPYRDDFGEGIVAKNLPQDPATPFGKEDPEGPFDRGPEPSGPAKAVEPKVGNRKVARSPSSLERDRFVGVSPKATHNKNPVVSFPVPTVSETDLARLSTAGIDPNHGGILPLENLDHKRATISQGVLFYVDPKGILHAWDLSKQQQLNQVFDRQEIVAVGMHAEQFAAKPSTHEPSVWVQLGDGRVEYWKLLNGRLQSLISIKLEPVPKNLNRMIAGNNRWLVFNSAQDIVILEYRARGGNILSQKRIPIPERINDNSQAFKEPVHAIGFRPQDGIALVAVGSEILEIDCQKAAITGKTDLDGRATRGLEPVPMRFNSRGDLLLRCEGNFVVTHSTRHGQPVGTYHDISPLPFSGVIAGGDQFVAVPQSGSDQLPSLFDIVPFVSSSIVKKKADVKKKTQGSDSKKSAAALSPNPGVDPEGVLPFRVSRSPALASPAAQLAFIGAGEEEALLILNRSNQILIGDWKQGWEFASFDLPNTTQIRHLLVAPDDLTFATSSREGVTVWKRPDENGTLEQVARFSGHTKAVTAFAFTANSESIISGDDQGELMAWSASTGKLLKTIEPAAGRVIAISSARGDHGFAAIDSMGVMIGNLKSNSIRRTPFPRRIPNFSILSPDGNRIASQSGGSIQIGDRKSLKNIGAFGKSGSIRSMKFSSHPRFFFTGEQRNVVVWDYRKSTKHRSFSLGQTKTVDQFAINRDASLVAVSDGSRNAKIYLFSLADEDDGK